MIKCLILNMFLARVAPMFAIKVQKPASQTNALHGLYMRNDSTEIDDNDTTNSFLEFQEGLKYISSHKSPLLLEPYLSICFPSCWFHQSCQNKNRLCVKAAKHTHKQKGLPYKASDQGGGRGAVLLREVWLISLFDFFQRFINRRSNDSLK